MFFTSLGRLAFDIARLGFECQGNEFSLFMLFTSNFVLNKCNAVNSFKIHPYIHNFCNNISNKDQLKAGIYIFYLDLTVVDKGLIRLTWTHMRSLGVYTKIKRE